MNALVAFNPAIALHAPFPTLSIEYPLAVALPIDIKRQILAAEPAPETEVAARGQLGLIPVQNGFSRIPSAPATAVSLAGWASHKVVLEDVHTALEDAGDALGTTPDMEVGIDGAWEQRGELTHSEPELHCVY